MCSRRPRRRLSRKPWDVLAASQAALAQTLGCSGGLAGGCCEIPGCPGGCSGGCSGGCAWMCCRLPREPRDVLPGMCSRRPRRRLPRQPWDVLPRAGCAAGMSCRLPYEPGDGLWRTCSRLLRDVLPAASHAAPAQTRGCAGVCCQPPHEPSDGRRRTCSREPRDALKAASRAALVQTLGCSAGCAAAIGRFEVAGGGPIGPVGWRARVALSAGGSAARCAPGRNRTAEVRFGSCGRTRTCAHSERSRASPPTSAERARDDRPAAPSAPFPEAGHGL